MQMIFRDIYLFSPHEKKACHFAFTEGLNVVTSNQENGTDRGKSVLMRSFYHALGAEGHFENKWETKNKVYILRFTIDDDEFYIYRAADLFKFFDGDKRLIFVSTHRSELAEQLETYTHFAVQLQSRGTDSDEGELEITPPAYNYLPFFLDQDHYEGSRFDSFKNLAQYVDYKNAVLFYHFGIYNEEYFRLVKEKERRERICNDLENRQNLYKAMLVDINKKIQVGTFSGTIDVLKKDVERYQKEYQDILSKLNRSKARLIELQDTLSELEDLLEEMNRLSKTNEKEIEQLRGHICPECGSEIKITAPLKSKRFNLSDDIIIIKNDLEASIHSTIEDIAKEEESYERLLDLLRDYDERVKYNSAEINDIIRYRGLCEIRDGVVSDMHDTLISGVEEKDKLTEIKEKIKTFNEKKKSVEEVYYTLLVEAKTKFGLNELSSDKFKSIKNTISASGSNKNIVTVVWYLAILTLREKFNPNAIKFPVVFDSPNNVETDDDKKHALIEYIFEKSPVPQTIISSIGFDSSEFSKYGINVISLENDKYHLLDEKSYARYESLLMELCDAEIKQ